MTQDHHSQPPHHHPRTIGQTLLIALIKFYRFFLSPWVGRQCRFTPSCSAYGLQAIEQHGAWRGLWLTLKRIGRCHPWSQGGIDPVPSTHDTRCTVSRSHRHREPHE